MPQLRSYPEAGSIEATDAFVIDRVGTGSMYIEESVLNPARLMIDATLPSGTTDTWAPTGYVAAVDSIVVTTDAGGSTLAGLSGGSADRPMRLLNAGPGDLVLTNGASGTAADSFVLPGAASFTIESGGGAALVYDAIALRWRLLEAAEVVAPAANTRCITFLVDGQGAALSTGIAGDLYIPFACTIQSASLLADQSGSVVVDIWSAAYASYPPTIANTIVASAPPTLASATHSQDATLTGWTKALAANSTLRFKINSVSTITRLTIALTVA